jgi:hypothetical protein
MAAFAAHFDLPYCLQFRRESGNVFLLPDLETSGPSI